MDDDSHEFDNPVSERESAANDDDEDDDGGQAVIVCPNWFGPVCRFFDTPVPRTYRLVSLVLGLGFITTTAIRVENPINPDAAELVLEINVLVGAAVLLSMQRIADEMARVVGPGGELGRLGVG
eukprot:COSAG05_NODE_10180_length_579_cov_0.752083_1_plen_123_part_01